MSRVIGYVLSAVGVLFLILAIETIRTSTFVLSLLPIGDIPSYVFMGIGVVCMAISVIFLRGSGKSKQLPEVPIYEGKNVVGFRRMKKR